MQTLISWTFLSRSLEYLLDFQLADLVTVDTRKLCLRIHVMANLQRDEFPSSHSTEDSSREFASAED